MKIFRFFIGCCWMLYAISANAAPTITDSDLHSILEAGHWSPQIEDNLAFYHEQLPASVIREWVNRYAPAKEDSSAAIGALVLTTGVANWGGRSGRSTGRSGRRNGLARSWFAQ